MLYRLYLRQRPLLPSNAQEKLHSSHVAIVGCGGVGSVVASLLARMGVGRITVIDYDVVELDNLNRGALHTFRDVGRLKAYSCREKLEAINPDVEVTVRSIKLDESNVHALLSDADVVVAAVDGMRDRQLLNEYAVATGKPLVSVAAERKEGLVALVIPGKTPCLACIYGLHYPPPQHPPVMEPVVTLAAGVAAGLVRETLLGNTPRNTVYVVDGVEFVVEPLEVERNPHCPICVERRFRLLRGDELVKHG